ncbi:unnamed protein product [Owenia fusiformis]|uniref:Uncharacterized protein n=1 Tax=Owenia fusiformis TaxID=6347 RepID=A0A8J1TUE3_OWEFU|nr:unnamed protein product [Owenia fusiformis]
MSGHNENTGRPDVAMLHPPNQPFQNFTGEIYNPMRTVFIDKQHSSKLHTNLWNMREKGLLCDITVRLGNCTIPAHECILNAMSDWFSAATSYTTRDQNKETLIDMDDIQGIQIMDLLNVIRYLYIGELEVNRVNYQGMLTLCTKLKLGFAIAYIQSYINKLSKETEQSSSVKLEIKEEDIKREVENDDDYNSMDTSMEQSQVESDSTVQLDSDSLTSDNQETASGHVTMHPVQAPMVSSPSNVSDPKTTQDKTSQAMERFVPILPRSLNIQPPISELQLPNMNMDKTKQPNQEIQITAKPLIVLKRKSTTPLNQSPKRKPDPTSQAMKRFVAIQPRNLIVQPLVSTESTSLPNNIGFQLLKIGSQAQLMNKISSNGDECSKSIPSEQPVLFQNPSGNLSLSSKSFVSIPGEHVVTSVSEKHPVFSEHVKSITGKHPVSNEINSNPEQTALQAGSCKSALHTPERHNEKCLKDVNTLYVEIRPNGELPSGAESHEPTIDNDNKMSKTTFTLVPIKKFVCEKCDEVLQNGTYLRYHMLMEHSTKWVGACHHCEYITCHKDDMATHLFNLHKNVTTEYPLMECQVGECNYRNVNPRCIKRHRDNHRDSAYAEAQRKGQDKSLISEEIYFPKLKPVDHPDYELLKPEYTKRLFYSDPNKNKRPNKKRKLPCHKCDEDFDVLRVLRFHVMEVHEGKWVGRCKKCDYMHDDKNKLAVHVFQKHKEVSEGFSIMDCTVKECDYKTVEHTSLSDHMVEVHNVPADSDVDTVEETRGKDKAERAGHDPKQYKCGRCDAMFHSRHLLKCHLYEGHKKQGTIVMCDHCDEFRSYGRMGRSELSAHMNEKHRDVKDSPKHACQEEDCLYTSKNVKHMRAHMEFKHNIHSAKRLRCEYCSQEFITMKQLAKHKVNKHSVNYKLSCEYPGCNEKFVNRYYRLKHQNEVHKKLPPKVVEKRYLCTSCEYRCNGSKDLIEHEAKKHESPVPDGHEIYHCEQCSYWTLRYNFIVKHKAAHAGIKNYFCEFCEKAFTTASQRSDHVRIHKDKKFICSVPECKGAFHYKWSLKNHMANVHKAPEFQGQLLRECTIKGCDYRGYSKPALEAHIKKQHSSGSEQNSEDSTSDDVDNQLDQQAEDDNKNSLSFVISNTQSLQGFNEMTGQWGNENTEIEYESQNSNNKIEFGVDKWDNPNGPVCQISNMTSNADSNGKWTSVNGSDMNS